MKQTFWKRQRRNLEKLVDVPELRDRSLVWTAGFVVCVAAFEIDAPHVYSSFLIPFLWGISCRCVCSTDSLNGPSTFCLPTFVHMLSPSLKLTRCECVISILLFLTGGAGCFIHASRRASVIRRLLLACFSAVTLEKSLIFLLSSCCIVLFFGLFKETWQRRDKKLLALALARRLALLALFTHSKRKCVNATGGRGCFQVKWCKYPVFGDRVCWDLLWFHLKTVGGRTPSCLDGGRSQRGDVRQKQAPSQPSLGKS